MQEQPQDTRARPIVACLRCREQKLRCDRELPSCERCRKQSAVCTYPAPPNRKQIAQKTSRARASQSNNEKRTHQSELSSAAIHTAKRRCISQDAHKHFYCLAEPETAELPSTEIGLLLQEVFYKRIYNATLMFHKTVSFQVYMLKKMPEYLQRAIFALAAIFLQEVDSPYQKYIKTLPMPTVHDKSWSWAHAASVEVLSHVDEPSVLKIQTLQVLQLYYLSRGEITRAKVHASLAYQLSRLLGYDKLCEPGSSSPNRSLQFDREIRRRSFWASWCTMCLGGEDFTSFQLCRSAAGLPLPARYSTGGSIQGVDLTIGSQLSHDWKLHMGNEEPNSLMAELVRILGIWTKVKDWVLQSGNRSNAERTGELVRLDELSEDVERSMNLPIVDISATAESYGENPELLVSFCSIYHLSRLLIPAFEVTVIEKRRLLLVEAFNTSVGVCTRVVFDQAMGVTTLLQQLVTKNLDITKLWPFTGYAAFLVGHIFLDMYVALLQSKEPLNEPVRLPGPDSDEMKTLQTVLGVLSIYWKPLRILAAKLNETIQTCRSIDASASATPAFPWDYINFFSEGEPVSYDVKTNREQQRRAHTNIPEGEDTPQNSSMEDRNMSSENSVFGGYEGHTVGPSW